MQTSLAMIEGLANLGFSTICATPHQKTGQYLPSLESLRKVHRELIEELKAKNPSLKIPLATENMWDSTLYERMEAGTIPGYDQSQVFLMEFVPNQLPIGLFERIFDLRCKGMLPVVAHPERYSPLWRDQGKLEKLASDCAMVVDLGALAGDHGRKQAKYARKMVLEGIAHAAASDAHEISDIKSAAAGIAWIRKKASEQALERLLATNPAKILEGKHPDG